MKSNKLPLNVLNKVQKSETFIPENIMNIKFEKLNNLTDYEKELLVKNIRDVLISKNKTQDGKIKYSQIDEIDNIIIKGISNKLKI
jgi:hypothetical protein